MGRFPNDLRRVRISLEGPRVEDLDISDEDLRAVCARMDDDARRAALEAVTILSDGLTAAAARLEELPPLYDAPRRVR